MNQRPPSVRVPPISNPSTATNSEDSTAAMTALSSAQNSDDMMISYEMPEITGSSSTDEQIYGYGYGVSRGDMQKYVSLVRIKQSAKDMN